MNSQAQVATNPSPVRGTYPCASSRRRINDPVVLIHGWGADSAIWGQLPQRLSEFCDVLTLDLPGFGDTPRLEVCDVNALIDWLARRLPQRCVLIGLSLGGMLSAAFAAVHPQRIKGLVTIASNARFVAGEQWSHAMPAGEFDDFLALWQQNQKLCLKRFQGLEAQGDGDDRLILRQLRALDEGMNPLSAEDYLYLLGSLDNRAAFRQLHCSALALLGENDALVPAAARDQLVELNPGLQVEVIPQAAHLPHLSAEDLVVEHLLWYFDALCYQLDKLQVAESFGRAAPHYDAAAALQTRIGNRLLNRIGNCAPDSIVDLGCGTGYHCAALRKQFPRARVIGVDIARGMLDVAASRWPEGEWLQSDAEDLSLDDASQSLIFSNFALQWCPDLDSVCSELARVLRADGEIYFALPGPETLRELRTAWRSVDAHIHVNRFASAEDWRAALVRAGLADIRIESELAMERHPDVKDLLYKLKQVGAHNLNHGRQNSLTGKQHLRRLFAAYDAQRLEDGSIPATWEIIFGYARKT